MSVFSIFSHISYLLMVSLLQGLFDFLAQKDSLVISIGIIIQVVSCIFSCIQIVFLVIYFFCLSG